MRWRSFLVVATPFLLACGRVDANADDGTDGSGGTTRRSEADRARNEDGHPGGDGPVAGQRDAMPVACNGALLGAPCDDSFLPAPEPGDPYPLRFVCEASAAHDPMCRPRLSCVDRVWQAPDGFSTGPGAPHCDVFPRCADVSDKGFCEGSNGQLCLPLNDGLHCDQAEVFHGPMVLLVPQAGSPCAENGKRVYDCGMGGGDRRCVGGIWLVADGPCF